VPVRLFDDRIVAPPQAASGPGSAIDDGERLGGRHHDDPADRQPCGQVCVGKQVPVTGHDHRRTPSKRRSDHGGVVGIPKPNRHIDVREQRAEDDENGLDVAGWKGQAGTVRVPYRSKTGSRETTVASNRAAWATSMRSNGFR
jgi:hypothetical protein